MKIRFKKYDALLPLAKFKAHPKNRNQHPEDQIARLAEILKYQGVRLPITVSKRSGFITRGHGRLLAAQKLKWKTFPVVYQDYDDDAQEYADLIADNSIANWAELDVVGIRADLAEFDDGLFDPNMLGLQSFSEEARSGTSSVEFQATDFKFENKCPKCGFEYGKKN